MQIIMLSSASFLIYVIILVMPCLSDIVADLQEQVTRLSDQGHSGQDCSSLQTPSFNRTTLRTGSSSLNSSRPSSGSSTPINLSDSDIETELVSFLA